MTTCDAPNANLLQLSLELWSEAATEHKDAAPTECPACWKAFMANQLWKHLTELNSPTSYYDDHRAVHRSRRHSRVRTANHQIAA